MHEYNSLVSQSLRYTYLLYQNSILAHLCFTGGVRNAVQVDSCCETQPVCAPPNSLSLSFRNLPVEYQSSRPAKPAAKVIDSHSDEMSQEEVCCSCPGLEAFCQRLFMSSDKTEAKKPTNTAKLQTANVPSPSRASASDVGSELYKALWSYKARGADELSFQEGEQFRICERQGEWWTALKLGRDGAVTGRGFVPNHYLARRQTVKEKP